MYATAFIAFARQHWSAPAQRTETATAMAPDPNAAVAKARLVKAVSMVFLPFAAGYYFSYFFRSTNAIIAPQLTSELELDGGDLGLLTAMYFFTFAAFQLPLGVLLDRYGPRRVQFVLLMFAASGSVLFSIGEDILVLATARGLIGLGVAGCLMASIKAGTQWFDDRHWPVVNGCMLAVGGLGAASATAPMEAALGFMDWREIFLVLSGATLGTALLIFLVVPERGGGGSNHSFMKQVRELTRIYSDMSFWRIAPLTVTGMAANMSIQGLWAGPWLSSVAGFDRIETANTLLFLALALAGGSVMMGIAAAWLERRGVHIVTSFAVAAAFFMVFQALLVFEVQSTAIWPWIGFGMFSNIAMITFAHITRHFPPELAGRSITAMNMLIFAGIFLMQYLMGEILDLWVANAAGQHPPEAFAASFGAVLALQVLSFLWFLIPIDRVGQRP